MNVKFEACFVQRLETEENRMPGAGKSPPKVPALLLNCYISFVESVFKAEV